MEALFDELIAHQLQQLRRLAPHLTDDDLLQPNDYLELEHDPRFRYEEGVLEGLQSALTAARMDTSDSCV